MSKDYEHFTERMTAFDLTLSDAEPDEQEDSASTTEDKEMT